MIVNAKTANAKNVSVSLVKKMHALVTNVSVQAVHAADKLLVCHVFFRI